MLHRPHPPVGTALSESAPQPCSSLSISTGNRLSVFTRVAGLTNKHTDTRSTIRTYGVNSSSYPLAGLVQKSFTVILSFLAFQIPTSVTFQRHLSLAVLFLPFHMILSTSQFSLRLVECPLHCRGCLIQGLLILLIILVT